MNTAIRTFGKGSAIPCAPRLDPNHLWGSACGFIHEGISIILLLLFLPAAATPCTAETLQIKDAVYQIDQYLEFLEDSGRAFTINAVRSAPLAEQFSPATKFPANFGLTDSAYWIRMQLRPVADGPWLLEISSPRLDRIDLYAVSAGGETLHKTSGLKFPFRDRDVPNKDFVFRLPLTQGTMSTVYLRVESSDAIFVPVTLWPEHRFAEHETDEQFGLGMYYGLLAVMGLVNLLVFFAIKDKSHLYFALFLFSFTLVLMGLSGLSDRLLFGDTPWWAKRSLPFFEGLSAFWAVLFTRSFLQTEKNLPDIHRILSSLIIPALLVVLLALLFEYQWSIIIMIALGIGSAAVIQTTAIMCWQRGFRPARYFLIAWAVFLLGTVIYALAALGALTFNIFTNNILQVGVGWMAVLMSLALTDRFNILEQEKRQAQKRIIEEQDKAMSVQRSMMESISRFVPRQFLSFLKREDITDVQLGDAVLKNMAVLFTDIRGFTGLSEGMTPNENFHFLNAYLEHIGPVVEAHHGFVDKFIGDAIMALFPESADHAVQAAIEMRRQLAGFNRLRSKHGLEAIDSGIGIHCGNLMLGTVGTQQRLDTTVIGDTVNLASRLEGQTKKSGAAIIISEAVHAMLADPEAYCLREIDMVQVRGKNIPVTIYEVFDADPATIKEEKFSTRMALQQALAHCKQGDYARARPLLGQCLGAYPEDRVAQRLLQRCDDSAR